LQDALPVVKERYVLQGETIISQLLEEVKWEQVLHKCQLKLVTT